MPPNDPRFNRADPADAAGVRIDILVECDALTGSDFRAWRKAADMTQIEAARAIGVSRRTVQIWEAAPDAPIPKPVAHLVRLMAPADA